MIVYCDGSQYDGAPENAPDKPVALIVQGQVDAGGSWYVHVYGKWRREFCKDEADRHRSEGRPVLKGDWMPDEEWNALLARYV